MKLIYGLLGVLFLVSCNNSANDCDYTNATPGSDRDALVDRVLLNTEYYFSNERADLRKDIYANSEFANLCRGEVARCIDDKFARSTFDISIESLQDTSATVTIRSRKPAVFNWFDEWSGTREVWNVVDGNWKLTESLSAINADSDFMQTYFSD